MERLKKKLEDWLPKQFPGAEVALELGRPGTKLGGILAWKGFEGLEPIDRQRILRQKIKEHFKQEDQIRISLIVTLSPAEYAVYREPQLA